MHFHQTTPIMKFTYYKFSLLFLKQFCQNHLEISKGPYIGYLSLLTGYLLCDCKVEKKLFRVCPKEVLCLQHSFLQLNSSSVIIYISLIHYKPTNIYSAMYGRMDLGVCRTRGMGDGEEQLIRYQESGSDVWLLWWKTFSTIKNWKCQSSYFKLI
jgi:hypothetical protein